MDVSFCEALFYLSVAVNLIVWGRWAPAWYTKFIGKHQQTIFTCHGPAVSLVLYFAHGDNSWKYLPASLLTFLVYDFGFIWSAEWYSTWNIITIALHHCAPLVAFYYQKPEEAWLNSLLYGQTWWIHGFGFLRGYIMPALGLGEIEKKSSFDYWLHRVYAALTPLMYVIYVLYLPFGWNYGTAAICLQFFGRDAVAGNLKKYDWMRRIETPGLLAVAFYNLGGLAYSVPVMCLYLVLVYFLERDTNSIKNAKLVLTDEIRDFIKSFPKEEPVDEEKKKEKLKWFDSQLWCTKYPMFRAILAMENDKVAQMLKDGTDHTQKLTEWWHSVPMQWAASGGNVTAMKLLIEAGANPFYTGVYEGTFTFGATHARDFLDRLSELATKDEKLVSSVTVDLLQSPVTFAEAQQLAQSKGGRLVSFQEATLVFAHRAAAAEPSDATTEDVSCFAVSDDSPCTFSCKVTTGETPIVLAGEASTFETSCSLLMWINSNKEKASETKKEA